MIINFLFYIGMPLFIIGIIAAVIQNTHFQNKAIRLTKLKDKAKEYDKWREEEFNSLEKVIKNDS